MQSYNAIATIGLAENLFIVACLGVNLFIPCERLTEICSKLCLNILALISNFAILCQVHCHDTIATCHSNESLFIISCLSIDNTIPIVLLTECSIKLTIYSYALWILWALLGQVQSHDAIATTCQWEGLNIITCYCIFYAVPNIWILAELSTKLCLNILTLWGWRYNWLALFFHVQCYDTIATIGLSKCSLVCTSFRDSNTIPNYWFTEITIHFCICILALIYSRTILCENQSNDAIASINSFDSLLICTSSSIDLTIPFERIAEFSLSCVTIYSYTWVWIWGTTVLSQYESNDAIATISSYVFLIIGALCAICDAIPCVSFIAEFSPSSITIDSLTWSIWSIWSYRDSINSSKLHEQAALFLINQCSELVVGYLYSSHASKHIVLVCSYRSSVLAVSINLRNDSNGIVVNIVINEEVDY